MEENNTIIMYSTTWCGDCKRSKRLLDKHQIEYMYIDVDRDQEALAIVKELNNGVRVVPTIVFPDGSRLVEPSDAELSAKLGLS